MKWLIKNPLLALLLFLSACGGGVPDPTDFSWCYTFYFQTETYAGLSFTHGSQTSLGLETSDGILNAVYTHGSIVEASTVVANISYTMPPSGVSSVAFIGNIDIFGIQATAPSSFSESGTAVLQQSADYPSTFGNNMTISVVLDSPTASVSIQSVTIYGLGTFNPFPTNDCFITPTATETYSLPSPTIRPTNTPTQSPTPTNTLTPTNTATPTNTTTATPSSGTCADFDWSDTVTFNGSTLPSWVSILKGSVTGGRLLGSYGTGGYRVDTNSNAPANVWHSSLRVLFSFGAGVYLGKVEFRYSTNWDGGTESAGGIGYRIVTTGTASNTYTIVPERNNYTQATTPTLTATSYELSIGYGAAGSDYANPDPYTELYEITFCGNGSNPNAPTPTATATFSNTNTPTLTATLNATQSALTQTSIYEQTQTNAPTITPTIAPTITLTPSLTPYPSRTLFPTPITIGTMSPATATQLALTPNPSGTPSPDNGYDPDTGEGGTCEDRTAEEPGAEGDGGWFEWLFDGWESLVDCTIMPPINFILDLVNQSTAWVGSILDFTMWGFDTTFGWFAWFGDDFVPWGVGNATNFFTMMSWFIEQFINSIFSALQSLWDLIIAFSQQLMGFIQNSLSFINAGAGSMTRLFDLWNDTSPVKPAGLPDCVNEPLEYDICAFYYVAENTMLSGTIGGAILPLLTSYIGILIFGTLIDRIKIFFDGIREFFTQ